MIHHGDLFDVLPALPEASVDACVCDPPYDLTAHKKGGTGEASLNERSPAGRSRISTGGGFMGKKWDSEGIAFNPETWTAVRRVLKPGAYLLAFGGTRTYHRMTCAIEDAGFEIRDCLSWLYGSGFPKSLNLPEGRGTALKPAWEPIILARKPLVGTVAGNVARFGTGALNVDACRTATVDGDYDHWREPDNIAAHQGFEGKSFASGPRSMPEPHALGRWPANVLLDPIAAALLDASAEPSVSRVGLPRSAAAGDGWGMTQTGAEYADAGGPSRFYYIAKPSREERDYGTEGLTARQRDESRTVGNPGGDNPRNRGVQPRGNFHPTVKPVELMRWLVRLVTPIGGTVLDPFMGSGTTGMACRYEQRPFVGIEREGEYISIAERRISAVAPLFGEEQSRRTAE